MNISPLSIYRKLKWSSRKLTLPINVNSNVLEVGSGGNPHPYSTVLVEKYISNKHRLKPIEYDNRLVIADACRLPFSDLSFDYSLSFHVLEHVNTPAQFLNEMQRTSKAGYIETPNFLYERLLPFDVHLLEIALIHKTLHIKLKESASPDLFIKSLDFINNDCRWKKLFNNRPDLFHVQYYWDNAIEYNIHNIGSNLDWFVEPDNTAIHSSELNHTKVHNISARQLMIQLLRRLNRRSFDMDSILVCPDCRKSLDKTSEHYLCYYCSLKYKRFPYPDFISREAL